MAKNSIDAYGAAGKTNLLLFDPASLTIVLDRAHALYDSRAHLEPSESMVRNVMHHGVLQPVVVTKDAETGKTLVVAGRQRVKAAIEANRRLAEQGCEPVQVPGTIRRANDADLAGVMASENAIRKDESAISRAEKMRKLLDLGRSEEQIGVIFGIDPVTVRGCIALLDCTQAVRDAVDAGSIPAARALKLAKLPPEQQREKVAELVKASSGLNGHAKARAQRAVVEGDGAPDRYVRALQRLIAKAVRDGYALQIQSDGSASCETIQK